MPRRNQRAVESYAENKRRLAEEIGSRIRQRRVELEIGQAALQGRMELKGIFVSRSELRRMENGDSLPDAAEIIALSAALGISSEWILCGG